jgi:hypothetical protein
LDVFLGAAGGFVEVGPLALQEGKVAHMAFRNRVFNKNPVSNG